MSKEWAAVIHNILSYTLLAIIILTFIGLTIYSIYNMFDFKSMWRKFWSSKDNDNDKRAG